MNYKKFFEEAEKLHISPCEIDYTESSSVSCRYFHGEKTSYSVSKQSYTKARGVYNGKMGSSGTEQTGNDGIKFLLDNIVASASLSEKTEAPEIFKGSKKYCKKNVYSKELAEVSLDVMLAKLPEIEKLAYAADKRITEVEIGFSTGETENILCNSYGLKLKSKKNRFGYFVEIIAKDGDEIKSDGYGFSGTDFSKFDANELVKRAVKNCVSKFKGTACKSKAYKCVLSRDTTETFLRTVVSSGLSAENVQKKTSLLAGKLGEQVFSKKVTVEEHPLDKCGSFSYFDTEGVATYNKVLIKNGVIKTYLYNLETAKKDGVESTGNGFGGGAKIGIGITKLVLKPGKMTEDELIAKVGNGVYITSVTGLHSGLDASSGDFSLEAEGFHIADGKKAGPMTLFTVGGNIYKLFGDVTGVANNTEEYGDESVIPSVSVKALKISCL